MEWKKDNTDSEKLRQMEKEYIEAALRMMKKAGIDNAATLPEAKNQKEEKEAISSVEIHNNTVTEEEAADEKEGITEEAVLDNEAAGTESDSENETEPLSDSENSEDEAMDAEKIHKEKDTVPEKEEQTEQEEVKEAKGGYGVYTADEIINGEGIIGAEKIIEEIKMQNETMRKLTEEQEKAMKPSRTCPKCGRVIDGST